MILCEICENQCHQKKMHYLDFQGAPTPAPARVMQNFTEVFDRLLCNTVVNNNRVVHGCHFRAIFHSFLNHFPFHFVYIFFKIETENERKMNIKWNPNLAFAKMELKNDHFPSFWPCAWREECIFGSFFWNSLSRVFTVTIFHTIFGSIFSPFLFVPLPNRRKWAKNEIENEPKMAPEWLPWTTLL